MKVLLQIALFFVLCMMSMGISHLLPFTFPASAIAMILLFLVFLVRALRPAVLRESSEFFTQNMAFFFIPASVGILDCFDRIRGAIIPILVICVISTFVTFAATVYTVRGITFLQKKYRIRRNRHE